MFSWFSPKRLPLIVAHRGSSLLAPENTLAAFERAIADGADAIELDVHLTADNEVVVIHDTQLRRTTNGRGNIEKCSYAEIRNFSAGAWFHRRFHAEKIPTLDEVFKLVKGRVGVNIEIKSPFRGRRGELLVWRCCEIVRRHHAEPITLFSSFHHRLIKKIKRRHPEIACGFLFHPLRRLHRGRSKIALRAGVDYIIVNSSMVRKRTIERAHGQGLLVGEYTVDNVQRFYRDARYGIDMVITNEPERFRFR